MPRAGGVAQDDRESVRWFRLAAEQGDAEAQAGLGLAYGAGRGVLQDFVALAYVDDSLCRTANWCDAKRRSEVSRYYCAAMTPEQIAEAQHLASEWDAADLR